MKKTNHRQAFNAIVHTLDRYCQELPLDEYIALLEEIENHLGVCLEAAREDKERNLR